MIKYTLEQFKKDVKTGSTPKAKTAAKKHLWFKFKYRTIDAVNALDEFLETKGVAKHLPSNQEEIEQLEMEVNAAFRCFLMTCGLFYKH